MMCRSDFLFFIQLGLQNKEGFENKEKEKELILYLLRKEVF